MVEDSRSTEDLAIKRGALYASFVLAIPGCVAPALEIFEFMWRLVLPEPTQLAMLRFNAELLASRLLPLTIVSLIAAAFGSDAQGRRPWFVWVAPSIALVGGSSDWLRGVIWWLLS